MESISQFLVRAFHKWSISAEILEVLLWYPLFLSLATNIPKIRINFCYGEANLEADDLLTMKHPMTYQVQSTDISKWDSLGPLSCFPRVWNSMDKLKHWKLCSSLKQLNKVGSKKYEILTALIVLFFFFNSLGFRHNKRIRLNWSNWKKGWMPKG